jgi:hypothetical protein
MEQINNDCGEIGSLNFLFGLPTNKFIIEEDGIVFNPPINPAAELIKKYKEFLIDKLDIVYKYHYTFGFKDLKLVLELDRFGNDEFWDEEDSDEECNEDDEEIITIYRCFICNEMKFIDDIVCIEIQPDKIWECCDCIAMEIQMERD